MIEWPYGRIVSDRCPRPQLLGFRSYIPAQGGREEEENGHRVSVQETLLLGPGDVSSHGPQFPPCSSTPASRDAQLPSWHPGGVGSSPASGGAAQRPTPPPATRLVPAPTPPSALEGWAAALSVPEPGTGGCWVSPRVGGPQPQCTCPDGRQRVPSLSSPACAFSRGARLSVPSVAEGAGESKCGCL